MKKRTTTSWSYSTDSTAGSYYGDVAPYHMEYKSSVFDRDK